MRTRFVNTCHQLIDPRPCPVVYARLLLSVCAIDKTAARLLDARELTRSGGRDIIGRLPSLRFFSQRLPEKLDLCLFVSLFTLCCAEYRAVRMRMYFALLSRRHQAPYEDWDYEDRLQ